MQCKDIKDADEGSEEHADMEQVDDTSAADNLGELLPKKKFVIIVIM